MVLQRVMVQGLELVLRQLGVHWILVLVVWVWMLVVVVVVQQVLGQRHRGAVVVVVWGEGGELQPSSDCTQQVVLGIEEVGGKRGAHQPPTPYI